MYIPQKFALSDTETTAALAQAGFAQLVTHDPSGLRSNSEIFVASTLVGTGIRSRTG